MWVGYMQTYTPFYTRDLSIHGFCYLGMVAGRGVLEPVDDYSFLCFSPVFNNGLLKTKGLQSQFV
jgi:hypothetical protein